MKVVPSKTNPNNKPNQTVSKSESVFRQTPATSHINAPPTPNAGAFEKILNENRKQSVKDEANSSKSDNRTENSESSEIKKEGEKDVLEKTELKEREQNKGGGTQGEGGDENENPAMSAASGVFSNGKISNENSIPAARSILHVADLERIVSTLRTFETKNSQQVLISLKNSILEGLQIKLTVDENGKLKAEFLASNERFKEHLKARRNELSEIFKNRGVKFQQLEFNTFSETESELKNANESDFAAGNII
ncbi:MAG: flagellar hook-length control protein FliK [Pyrinomonadaceae bacterium]